MGVIDMIIESLVSSTAVDIIAAPNKTHQTVSGRLYRAIRGLMFRTEVCTMPCLLP